MPPNENTDLTRSGLQPDQSSEGAGRSTAVGGAVADSTGPLAGVRRAETIADRTDFESVRRELPAGWDVRPDLVQFGTEPLAETVLFTRGKVGPRIVLKPARSEEPTKEIECYERSGPRASRRLTMTVETLSEALRVALNRTHQLDRGNTV